MAVVQAGAHLRTEIPGSSHVLCYPFSIIPFDPGLNYILHIHESDEQALPTQF